MNRTKLIELGILSIGLILTLHQLVQPIFFPIIESLSVKPLYIQSLSQPTEYGFDVKYYRIFEITYTVKPVLVPILPFQQKLTIDLPHNTELFAPLSGFTEKNSYAEIIYPKEALNTSLLDSNKFSKIIYQIKASGLSVGKFPISIFLRELTNLECSNLVFSNDRWWSSQNLPPDAVPKVECFTKRLGLGQINESGIVFSFDELIMRNRGELDVRGFVSKIGFGNSPQLIACENKRELVIMEAKGKGFREGAISVDLKSGETRRFIILKQVSEYQKYNITDKSQIKLPDEWKLFELTSPFCGADWNNFIQ